jgi:hypothetical protein
MLDTIYMKKGPLIASIVLLVLGVGLIITGSVMYEPLQIPDYLLWSGLIVFNVGLIVLVTAFLKRDKKKDETPTTNS